MNLTRTQKGMSIAAAIALGIAWLTDGSMGALTFCCIGIALIARVVHTLPKRTTKCTDL
jgi:hypothetical protein